MGEIFDVVIIGEGPAGLTAAIYAKRAQLDVLLIERFGAGGQILNTYEVDNYPGLPGISGFDLATKMSEHADKFSVNRVNTEVVSVDLDDTVKIIHTEDGDFQTYSVILATGNSPRKLGVSGEEELTGCGVSYCATCDGAFFRRKRVAVVGGGDVAVEDAIFLARGCEKVYLIHRRDELRAAKILQSALFGTKNVEIIWDSVVNKINGDELVQSIEIENVNTRDKSELIVSGIFIATGNTPNDSFLKDSSIERTEAGYIIADESCASSIPGVFVAGDLREKRLRQVSTAVADGANAVYSVQEYLLGLTKKA